MIYKKRSMPEQMKGFLALNKRLPLHHPQRPYVNRKLYQYQAGYAGEREFDRYLTEFKPDYPYAILHDLTLQHDGTFFQMDSVLLTPAGILIAEIKNIAGKVFIKPEPLQFIKEPPEGERKAMRNPITELERKVYHLSHWLRQRGWNVPIRTIVVFAYENELIFETEPPVDVLFTYEVPAYLRKLPVDHRLTKQDIKGIAKQLRQEDRPYCPEPLAVQLAIPSGDIQTGIPCPACESLEMKRTRRTWQCPHCGHEGKAEHEGAIHEWFLLFGDRLTNRDFRRFVKLENRNTARVLLSKSGLKLIGTRNQAYYIRE